MSGRIGHIGLLSLDDADSDPDFANVTSLLHCNGADGSTTFSDVAGNTWTRTGIPLISATQKRYGNASMFTNGGSIGSPTAMGAGIGAGDFCIEGYFWAAASGGTFRGLFDTRLDSTVGGIAVGFNTSAGQWQVYFGGAAHDAAGTMPTTAWTHWALERVSGDIDLYIGGSSQNSFTDASSNTDTALNYGAYFSLAAPWVGWIDECRVTVGSYRYGGPFTPPIAPFPNS